MSHKVNPLIFRAGVHGYWNLKIYPSNYTNYLIKQFNIYKALTVYFMQYRYSILGIKYFLTDKGVNSFVFLHQNNYIFDIKYKECYILEYFLSYYGDSWYELLYMHEDGLLISPLYKVNYLKKTNWIYETFYGIPDSPDESYRLLNYQVDKLSYKENFKFNKLKLKKLLFNFNNKKLKYFYFFFKKLILFYLYYCLPKKHTQNKVLKYNLVNKFYLNHLFFKIKCIEVEYILKEYFKSKVNINLFDIKYILNFRNLTKISPYSKIFLSVKLGFFKDFLHSFFFGLHFKNSYIINYVISRHITNQKRHLSHLRNVSKFLNYLIFYEATKDFLGLRIRVAGKFQGRLRKRIFKIFRKYKGLQRLSTFVDFSINKVYTRFGVFSIKVWLFFIK